MAVDGAGITLLVTVGSTQFPALTDFIALPSTLAELHELGISHVTLQHGSYTPTLPAPGERPPVLQPLRYHPQLCNLLRKADVVVSHAGAGTVLEAVDARRPLVVVVNDALMHNHQTELAEAMQRCGCCVVVSANCMAQRLIPAVRQVLSNRNAERSVPPPHVGGVFANVVAEELALARCGHQT
ncbi:unnamed protein product [Agarophyton chilense]